MELRFGRRPVEEPPAAFGYSQPPPGASAAPRAEPRTSGRFWIAGMTTLATVGALGVLATISEGVQLPAKTADEAAPPAAQPLALPPSAAPHGPSARRPNGTDLSGTDPSGTAPSGTAPAPAGAEPPPSTGAAPAFIGPPAPEPRRGTGDATGQGAGTTTGSDRPRGSSDTAARPPGNTGSADNKTTSAQQATAVAPAKPRQLTDPDVDPGPIPVKDVHLWLNEIDCWELQELRDDMPKLMDDAHDRADRIRADVQNAGEWTNSATAALREAKVDFREAEGQLKAAKVAWKEYGC